ncbi:Decarbamoylnovobiocin carbamoyltransferase [Acinetobacter oleivorans]|uniref:carbamoyltransferase C-terminal domain-containing protein n=1 Tax=Acinetobacter oleivorans TaxID=1148157 RepID=UPI0017851C1F|nr:carbamoyltransferase C-terminal domain-containing protein [Acinetobacter oleivorans]CAI3119715.1 Decarbamoylnovobiocin carbamoyltransferase [Acinetobacter oleivorans]CAI3119740.1 Decarbamoylnovobiocin carbamoyltransferase [Acinetobacter oleivorans]CAI3119830.1 Decarbamoylnovobiocin carbamoyltransferase [Acinetobacter oleivorans]CAI3119926.1 Decarbamoylnovobiocin carbamoyltransferase [Acinetobacter oleivorans]CAI3119931.1 Decarbamoylnovobiocin carbamoyltransferase [Acinetobacter oleivorans]
MKIYALKSGHDGSSAYVHADSGELVFSYEAEKDSFPRYEVFNPINLIESAAEFSELPDIVAISGWGKAGLADNAAIGAGYYGWHENNIFYKPNNFFGKEITLFTSSHERSHIWCSYALSPFEQGEPCYVLSWEGAMGDFYEVDENLNVHHITTVMKTPGNKYAFLYALADPLFSLPKGRLRYEDPGKLMALCAYGKSGQPTKREQQIMDLLLDRDSILMTLGKEDMRDSPYYNIGLDNADFHNLAKRYSDEIFNRFYLAAKKHLTKKLPLLITGGCGLNCDWNSMWRDSGLFTDVFVPPCTNDTGASIGTAVDAMREFTGKAKLSWSVYSGQSFIDDTPLMPDVKVYPLDLQKVAEFIAEDKIIAWTQGRCEIGPRALGNRSLLAAPFKEETRDRLNLIKKREGFRPIAPICLEEDVGVHFEWEGESPYMLYFQYVKNHKLKAITHIDGTARVQTVNEKQNKTMHLLLMRFKELTGAGVLCNTSLNFNGTGFINRTSDLYSYAKLVGLDGFVYNNKFCVLEGNSK